MPANDTNKQALKRLQDAVAERSRELGLPDGVLASRKHLESYGAPPMAGRSGRLAPAGAGVAAAGAAAGTLKQRARRRIAVPLPSKATKRATRITGPPFAFQQCDGGKTRHRGNALPVHVQRDTDGARFVVDRGHVVLDHTLEVLLVGDVAREQRHFVGTVIARVADLQATFEVTLELNSLLSYSTKLV